MNRLLWVASFWSALVVVTYLALTPVPPQAVFHVSDIFLHAGAFTVLTFLLTQAHFAGTTSPWWPCGLMLAFGIGIELTQSLVPARTAEIKDVVVDVAGIGVGWWMVRLVGEPIAAFVRSTLKKLGLS